MARGTRRRLTGDLDWDVCATNETESSVYWHVSTGNRTGLVDPTTSRPMFHRSKKIMRTLLLVAHAALLHVCCGSLIVALNPFLSVVLKLSHHTHPVQKVWAHATLIKWSLTLQCETCSEQSRAGPAEAKKHQSGKLIIIHYNYNCNAHYL